MNDYIKREDAQRITAEWLSGYITDDERNVIEHIDVDLGELPHADVRENIRGEWVDCGIHGDWAWEQDGHGNYWHIWKCSKCEHTTDHCSNYCPICGADMRGGKHEKDN